MPGTVNNATSQPKTGFFSKVGQHLGRHKVGYGIGAAAVGALAYFGLSSPSAPKPQNGPSQDTYQPGAMF